MSEGGRKTDGAVAGGGLVPAPAVTIDRLVYRWELNPLGA